MDIIENKVAASGLITLDPEQFMPAESEILMFDIFPFLFKGMILREKDFREALAGFDFQSYKGKIVGVYCSTDALIPMWAFMLLVAYLQDAQKVYFGTEEETLSQATIDRISDIDTRPYQDGRIVVKGCGKRNAGAAIYTALSQKLMPVARSVMYGEPCSTVPIYKRKKQS